MSEVGCSGSLQDETHEPVGQGVATMDESNQDSQVIQDQNAISEVEGSSSGQQENSANGIKGRLRGSVGKATDAGNPTCSSRGTKLD